MSVFVSKEIIVPDAPQVDGLAFRSFAGAPDYTAFQKVYMACSKADQYERVITVEDLERQYRHLVNCDPQTDVLVVEINNEVVGYSRVWWDKENDGIYYYLTFGFLMPAWRKMGIRAAQLRWSENRMREIAANQPGKNASFFRTWAQDNEEDWLRIIGDVGFTPERYFYSMVRPDLENIPDLALPAGLEVRSVQPEDYRKVWKAEEEAFRDHWGATEWKEEWYQEWIESPTFTPGLWQVAWDRDEVAGGVLNYIDVNENKSMQRKRGYTEDIFVRRPWRRRGLAKALIANSLKVLKAQGMEEAALGVDTENPSGALGLYEVMGFRQYRREIAFKKPLA